MGRGEEQGAVAAAAKAALRTRVRRSRAARVAAGGTPDVAAVLAGAALAASGETPLRRLVASTSPDRVVVAYAAVPGEPDLALLREALRRGGIRVLLPVVTGPGTMRWATDTGNLRPGRALASGLRIDEPDGEHVVDLVAAGLGPDDLVLVPALAVSRDGARLGQGGGFYDRALAGLPRHPSGPLVVAVVHDDELLADGAVPCEPHDRRVDAVLTPSAWVALEISPGGSGAA